MGNLLNYTNEKIKENVWVIGEKKKEWLGRLDKATELFNKKLEEIDIRSGNPKENPEELLGAVSEAILAMSCICGELERETSDKEVIKNAQIEFRTRTQELFSKTYFNRCRVWPQGYQGDYKMIEFLYRNTPTSAGVGYYLDKYLLATTLAEAVRERKETLYNLLKKELNCRKEPRVLDIACGSCREIFELSSDIGASGAKVVCTDFDSDALNYSASRLSYAGPASEQVEFRKYNALRMVSHERNLKEFGMQDVIYSVGFFDYIEDDVLVRLLNSLYKLLPPGGTLITSLKDSRRYATFIYHWLIDWDGFLQRREEDMWNLFERAEIPSNMMTVMREKSGVIIFFVATK